MAETTEKFSFDVEFQKKVIKLLTTDVNFLIKSSKYLKKEYFNTDLLQWAYVTVINYYEKYKKMITESVFLEEIGSNVKESKMEHVALVLGILSIEVTEKEYIIEKIEEFIKRNIAVKNIKHVVELYNNNHFEKSLNQMEECLRDIDRVSFERPNRSMFFEEFDERFFRRNVDLQRADQRFMTGVLELDGYTRGGLGRNELGIVCADSGVGKSIFLVNAGVSCIKTFAGKVLHICLEGKKGQTADRYEARILDENYRNIVANNYINVAGITNTYKRFSNTLMICELLDKWDYTVLDIEQIIEEVKADFVPDVIIVDYGDLLKSRGGNNDNTYIEQQDTFRDLKILANKYNVAVWTASQMARPDKSINIEDPAFIWTRRNLADSYAKVRIADLLITLNQTSAERKAKRMRIYIDKFRDDEAGFIINLNNEYEKMQFYRPTALSYENFNRSNTNG